MNGEREINKKLSGDSDKEDDDDDGEEKNKKDHGEVREGNPGEVNPPEDPEVAALGDVLFKTNLGYKLEKVQKIYHVSRSNKAMKDIKENGFKVYAADDANYDGLLATNGAPTGVFFCSTLYNKVLPTITMYPRPPIGETFKGNHYPRVAVDLQSMDAHNDYNLYLVKDPTTPANQTIDRRTLHVHIAMIHINNVEANRWAQGKLQPLDRKNSIFTYDEDKCIWLAPELQQTEEGRSCNVWTNIFLIPAPEDNLLGPLRNDNTVYDNVRHL